MKSVHQYRVIDISGFTRIDPVKLERELNLLAEDRWYVHTAVDDYILMEKFVPAEETQESISAIAALQLEVRLLKAAMGLDQDVKTGVIDGVDQGSVETETDV